LIKLLALYKEGSYTDYHGSFCLIFTQVRHILDRAARSFLFSVSPLNASLAELDGDISRLGNYKLLAEFTNTTANYVTVSENMSNFRYLLLVQGNTINDEWRATSIIPVDLFRVITTYFIASSSSVSGGVQHNFAVRIRFNNNVTVYALASSDIASTPTRGILYGIR